LVGLSSVGAALSVAAEALRLSREIASAVSQVDPATAAALAGSVVAIGSFATDIRSILQRMRRTRNRAVRDELFHLALDKVSNLLNAVTKLVRIMKRLWVRKPLLRRLLKFLAT